MKIGFFEIKPGEQAILEPSLKDHQLVFSPDPIPANQLLKENDFDILSTHTSSKIDSRIIHQMANLKLIATRTTGYDHIDLAAAKARQITVCNVPTYGEITVAEYTFALLLDLARKVTPAINRLRQDGDYSNDGLQGFDLAQKTIGVIGTGHIGQHVIKMANGFSMTVIAYDAYPKPELEPRLNFKYVKLEELLSQSDIISLHVPYLPSTHHLINQANITNIKKGAVLINTARGAVVETQALILALQTNILAGAALDVLEEEQALQDESKFLMQEDQNTNAFKTVLQNHILIDFPNVIITPHNAFNTIEAQQRIDHTTIENINNFLKQTPSNIIKLD